MNRLGFLLAVLLGVCLCANSYDDLTSSTGQLNGHVWLGMTQPQKVFYLHGVYDGMAQAQLILIATKVKEPEGLLTRVPIKGMTYGEITTALDAFYADASNVLVPVLFAHEWLKHKVGGASTTDLDTEAAKLRAMFAKDGK